ncbi:patatin-like phospholipase family protein [Bradyrhizobium sp. DASA03068]|uniref:patatin-like phospholipase family protein n=1 Tax=Bradyrhizobium sp. BLXBL-01 TaxID=3395915 RepID=UPI003F6F491C
MAIKDGRIGRHSLCGSTPKGAMMMVIRAIEYGPVMYASRSAMRVAALFLMTGLLCGCASMFPRDVVPKRLIDEAELAGMPNVRVWGDAPPEALAALSTIKQIRRKPNAAHGRLGQRPDELNILAISGGGDNGAFGAGLLVGWGDAGTRPEFDLVTGVSAGALTAPFVYLGRTRDAALKEVFTRYERSDIYDPGVVAPLLGSGLVDSSPLESLIAKYVDDQFLRDIAMERRKGRVLLIGTTNLDAQRPVLWDVGRIAMSNHPQVLPLFRKILLASASVPGAFPPVRIKVSVADRTYEELHVDGGVTQQVFVPRPSTIIRTDVPAKRAAARLFIIRNGKINPEWEAVEPGIFSISLRSISTLIKNQSIGDLYRIYAKAEIDGTDFNLAAIPSTFRATRETSFEQGYMQALYTEGYRSGFEGYQWMKAPPGITNNPKPLGRVSSSASPPAGQSAELR